MVPEIASAATPVEQAAASSPTDSPAPVVVNVKDHGAVGNGTTDDTAAIAAARDALLATMVSNASGASAGTGNGIPLVLYFPAGRYKVTKADTLMFSPTSGTAQPIRNLRIVGAGRRVSEIFFSTGMSASNDPRQGNLMTLANRVRALTVEKMSFSSDNINQTFCYMWCSATNDGTYSRFGSGAQNDVKWNEVEVRGKWKHGWLLDGDTHANQNSEQVWQRCGADNSTRFGVAAIKIGNAPFAAQQDQFLNYRLDYCNFEYDTGDFLQLNMGGHVHITGGSYILGIVTPGGGGTFFSMPVAAHAFNVKHLTVRDTRFEFRTKNCQLLNTAWGGTGTHVTLENISVATDQVAAADRAGMAIIAIKAGNTMGSYTLRQCELDGYISIVTTTGGSPATAGALLVEQCNSRNNAMSVSPTGFVRVIGSGSVQPRVQLNLCVGKA